MLWPIEATPEAAAVTVTVRVDQIKGVGASSIANVFTDGKCWTLVRSGAIEGTVELCELAELLQPDLQPVAHEGAAANPPGSLAAGERPARCALRLWSLNRDARAVERELPAGDTATGAGETSSMKRVRQRRG